MNIRLAIHARTSSYSNRWIEYCREHGLAHEVVDCYQSGIIDRLKDFDALLWHINHENPTDLLMGRHVLSAAEHMGLVVFPNTRTNWHFDDKLAQKYLLEAVGAPLMPTYISYDRRETLRWLETARYPLVYKLRRGAGSHNVGLLRNRQEARRCCGRAFGKGFVAVPGYFSDASIKVRKIANFKNFLEKLKRMPAIVRRNLLARRRMARESGYVLFQEYAPDNQFDTRIAVIGRRAWGFTRNVRKNDFRASGSGSIDYDVSRVNPDCIRIAFEVSQALECQCMAYDFVVIADGEPRIVEMSFGFISAAVYACTGYWNRQLQWVPGRYWPEDAVLEDILEEIRKRKAATA